jgi:hypothetical protein
MHKIKNISYFTTISAIAIFGLISICSLIITSVTSGYFQTLAFIVHYLPDHKKGDKDPADNKVTFVGGRWVPGFSWIITYIFDKEVDFKKFYINSEIKTPKVLLIVDSDFRRFLSSDKDEKSLQSARMLLENTEKISEIKDKSPPLDSRNYPYSIMKIVKRQTMLSPIEIRTNY